MQTLAMRNEIGKRQIDKKTKILRKREYSGNSLERSLEHNNLEGPELLETGHHLQATGKHFSYLNYKKKG